MQLLTNKLILALLAIIFTLSLSAQPRAENLRCEYLENPVGIDVDAPRLSWWMQDTAAGAQQTAYEIRVAKTAEHLGKRKRIVWSSGKVASAESNHIAYAGPALKSGERRYWQVRIWNQEGESSEWSAPAFWETGLLSTEDWTADWVTLANEPTSETSLPAHYYRKEFNAGKKISSARLYATSHGIYECFINGKKVGDQLFTPGFTSYHKRLQYQTYDVTDMLAEENTLTANVADGWFRGYLGWKGERAYYGDQLTLLAANSVPVKAIAEITPQEIIITPKGERVYDLGQNIVGRARIRVQGSAGDSVVLRFAEVLDKEGNFYTTNLRAAEATDVYVLKGEGVEVFEPRFTFHGFRFIEVVGFEPTVEELTGIVIHSDMTPTGTFTCSDPLINQLQSNIQWGQKDNFLDIPTDCPQRDERAGWTGDAQVFSMTAAFNFDVAAFYTKWLKDLAADQLPNGKVTHVVPDMWGQKGGATAWGDRYCLFLLLDRKTGAGRKNYR